MNNYYNKNLKALSRNLRSGGTKAEACIWKFVLRGGQMKGYQFKRQRPVLGYIADFICEELRLIIEIDGITHQGTEAALRDEKRTTDLAAAGFTVIRFTDQQVLREIKSVATAISDWIGEKEEELRLSSPANAQMLPRLLRRGTVRRECYRDIEGKRQKAERQKADSRKTGRQ